MKITCIAILPFFGSILADRLVSIPFKSAQKNTYANALGIKKLGRLVDVPLENIDLAYLVDLAVG
jgi:hypothetical protein